MDCSWHRPRMMPAKEYDATPINGSRVTSKLLNLVDSQCDLVGDGLWQRSVAHASRFILSMSKHPLQKTLHCSTLRRVGKFHRNQQISEARNRISIGPWRIRNRHPKISGD